MEPGGFLGLSLSKAAPGVRLRPSGHFRHDEVLVPARGPRVYGAQARANMQFKRLDADDIDLVVKTLKEFTEREAPLE